MAGRGHADGVKNAQRRAPSNYRDGNVWSNFHPAEEILKYTQVSGEFDRGHYHDCRVLDSYHGYHFASIVSSGQVHSYPAQYSACYLYSGRPVLYCCGVCRQSKTG
jgi:hypothetical protein